MAAYIGGIVRVFSQKCRVVSSSIARPCLLNNGRQSMPVIQLCQNYSEDLPKKPKRPSASFIKFTMEKRPEILAVEPDLNVTEVTKRIAALWKDLPDAEKEIYKSSFESEMSKFHEEMESFKSHLTDEQLDMMTEKSRKKRENRAKRKHKMEMKKLNKPKRPLTAYTLFVKSHLNSAIRPVGGNTQEEIQALFKEAGEAWKTIPEYERRQYNEEAARLSEAYREEIREWKQRMEAEGHKV